MARVLVIDDEPMIGLIASRILERAGHSVVVAVSGDEALSNISRESVNFDLVIVDETMPGLSARETIRQLLDQNPTLRAILSSGKKVDVRGYVKEFGEQVISLPKPYRSDELVKAVQDLLDK